MRVYIAADKKPLTAIPTAQLVRIVANDKWAPWVADQNACTTADLTAQCAVILKARALGLMPETV